MNFTQSFEEFSAGIGPMDLALYAGAGIIIWILFKDKMSPVQKFLMDYVTKVKENYYDDDDEEVVPVVKKPKVPTHVVTEPPVKKSEKEKISEDPFFQLVASWKQTRDLAVKTNCDKAVEVADQMFPFLSPMVCNKKEEQNNAE